MKGSETKNRKEHAIGYRDKPKVVIMTVKYIDVTTTFTSATALRATAII